MEGRAILLVVVSALLASQVSGLITASEETTLRGEIRQFFEDDAVANNLNARDKRIIGGLVRLAFHDCVGVKCDGCINPNKPDNAGLEVYIPRLEDFYQTNVLDGGYDMSRADFWVLAAMEGLHVATTDACRRNQNCDEIELEFKQGREDCAGGGPATTDDHTFPHANGSGVDTTNFFAGAFGFNTKESVAIMGAHTLGSAHKPFSGYRNRWVPDWNILNNDYYTDMVDQNSLGPIEWRMTSVGKGRKIKWQWSNSGVDEKREGRGKMLMLNADMGLHLDLHGKIDSDGKAGCIYSACGPAPDTAATVAQYAANNGDWVRDFAAAFTKMTSHGYGDTLTAPV